MSARFGVRPRNETVTKVERPAGGSLDQALVRRLRSLVAQRRDGVRPCNEIVADLRWGRDA